MYRAWDRVSRVLRNGFADGGPTACETVSRSPSDVTRVVRSSLRETVSRERVPGTVSVRQRGGAHVLQPHGHHETVSRALGWAPHGGPDRWCGALSLGAVSVGELSDGERSGRTRLGESFHGIDAEAGQLVRMRLIPSEILRSNPSVADSLARDCGKVIPLSHTAIVGVRAGGLRCQQQRVVPHHRFHPGSRPRFVRGHELRWTGAATVGGVQIADGRFGLPPRPRCDPPARGARQRDRRSIGARAGRCG